MGLVNQVKGISVDGVKIGPFIDEEIEKFDQRIKSVSVIAKKMVKDRMKMLLQEVALLQNMTADEIIDKSVALTVDTITSIVKYLDKMYNERAKISKKFVKKVKEAINKGYEKIKSLMPSNVTVAFVAVTRELSSVIKQLTELDVANPLWKAWNDANVIGQLRKYGVNDKVTALIRQMKDFNVTVWLVDTIKSFNKDTILTIKYLVNKGDEIIKIIGKQIEKTVKYIASIPKKEYKEWLKEECICFKKHNKNRIYL